ncbi:hypothetical protein CK203_084977 [Vitis vinifera]|uniref:Uncharacterized protein n=1 Tax=Vitis vinifera TaxID=29760 RepID=A0A438F063_VITVI|nr:hypothetical protein CK203_084977 [Vitis vinifera]
MFAGFCSWNVLELFGCSIIIFIAGLAPVEGDNAYFGTYWHIGNLT